MANPNLIDDATWGRLVPLLHEHCPRVTAADLADADQRMDLLTAKVQNRHWIDRIEARRLVLSLVEQARKASA